MLKRELAKVDRINQKAKGDILPEEEELIKRDFPSGGLHVHDENNPFGMHRHFLEDPIDGAHTHTSQNPQGEHVHGEFSGKAMIDGAHHHDGDTAWGSSHHHESDNELDKSEIVPQKQPKI